MSPGKAGRRLLLAAGVAILAIILAVSASESGPDPVGVFCRTAQAEVAQGLITQAVLDYNRGMATEPRDARPYVGLAVLYEALNRSDLAIEALQQLGTTNPQAPHLWCRLSEAHLGAEDVRGARDLGAVAVSREPDCARAFSNYGLALFRSRFEESAAAALDRAAQLAPDDAGINEARLDVALQRARFEEAASLAKQLLIGNPSSAKYHFNLGLAYSQMLNHPDAARQANQSFQRTMELAPQWFQPHAELARLYQNQGDLKQAAAEYERALQIDPRVPGVVYNLALLWRRAGDPRAAILQRKLPDLQRDAGRLDLLRARYYQEPDNVANLVATARTEAQNKQFPAALYRLRKLLAMDPSNLPLLQAYREIDRQARSGAPNYLRPGPDVTAL